MTVSPSFQAFVLDQLSRVVPRVHARRMFGGVGLWADERFFALMADDTLYVKVDATTRGEFESHGMSAFRPFGDARSMQYYGLSADLLEDTEALRPWVEKALMSARLAKEKGRPRRPPGTR